MGKNNGICCVEGTIQTLEDVIWEAAICKKGKICILCVTDSAYKKACQTLGEANDFALRKGWIELTRFVDIVLFTLAINVKKLEKKYKTLYLYGDMKGYVAYRFFCMDVKCTLLGDTDEEHMRHIQWVMTFVNSERWK